MNRTVLSVATLMLVAIGVMLPAAASATGPANDHFANATPITASSGSISGSTSGATSEAGEPCWWGCSPSVWYSWTPADSGTYGVNFNTCYSGFDTTLLVATGSMGALNVVAANDDACWLSSSAWFQATAGTTYHIRVSGYYGGSGSFVLNHSATRTNTAPSVAVTGVEHGAAYELGSVPSAGCANTDAEDGASSGAASLSAVTGARAAAGLGSQTASCSYTDASGVSASASATYAIVDTTAPQLTLPADIALTATSAAGAVATFAATAADAVDGPVTASCTPADGATFAPGTTTVSCRATDIAGNTATGSFTVTVTFAWSNLLAPVNVDGSSVYRLGSTVPVKFQLTAASAAVTDATARLYLTKVSNQVLGTEGEAVSTSAASTGNLFRYADGQYVFNLATKSLSTGTWRVRIELGDGVVRATNISLR